VSTSAPDEDEETFMLSWPAAERASQVAFVVACTVLAAGVALRYWPGRAERVGVATAVHQMEIVAPQAGLEPAAGVLTIVVVIDPSCIHCTASMPFYARLVAAAGRSTRPARVVFAGRQSADVLVKHLRQQGIRNPEVTGWLQSVAVRGTPTVLILDGTGRVLAGWLGRLGPDQEDAVLKTVAGEWQS
jgi:hypothetical protein